MKKHKKLFDKEKFKQKWKENSSPANTAVALATFAGIFALGGGFDK